MRERIFSIVNKTVEEFAMPGTFESLKIIESSLKENVALYGGAALVKSKIEA